MEKFILSLVKEFNEVRRNPKEYSKKVAMHMRNIKIKENQSYYEEKFGIKLKLSHYESTFLDCIEFLQQCDPIAPLTLNKQLSVEFPKDPEKLLDKASMLEKALQKKKEPQFSNKIFGFHFDKGSVNPETSCVIQLVDDNCMAKFRRNNILNPNFEEVGISVQKVNFKKSYIVYMSFLGKFVTEP